MSPSHKRGRGSTHGVREEVERGWLCVCVIGGARLGREEGGDERRRVTERVVAIYIPPPEII